MAFQKGNQISKGRVPWNKGRKTGIPAWNKGLTKETDGRMKKISEANKGRVGNRLGKPHSEETKKKMGKIIKKQYKSGRKLSSAIFKKGHQVPQKCIDALKFFKLNNPHGSNWKGGVTITKNGYRMILTTEGKHELEHRLVWKKHNGDILKGYVIHHTNGNKTDNRIENLQMMNRSCHSNFHYQMGDYIGWKNSSKGGEIKCPY